MLPSMPNLINPSVKPLSVSPVPQANLVCEKTLPLQNSQISTLGFPKENKHNVENQNDECAGMWNKADGLSGMVSEGFSNSDSKKEPNIEKDNIDDINALMKASSTIKNTKKEPSGAEKKRNKLRREFLCNLRMVTPEKSLDKDKKAESFASNYMNKLKETLPVKDFLKIMEILSTADMSKTDAIDLYHKIVDILLPQHQELAEEFLLFLNDMQANTVGKIIPFYMVKNMMNFLYKVDLYFQDKPTHSKRIFKTLTDLGEKENVSTEQIKSSILPLLKGNDYLTDLFLQNFIEELPPDSLIGDNFEVIDITKDATRPDNEEIFESITIPDLTDTYGNNNCICDCHKNNDSELESRKKHCIPCGTKYLQGKIFIQTGKGLRPAVVRFLTNPKKNHSLRLDSENTGHSRKRADSMSSKRSNSPIKECHDENRGCKKREDEGGGKKRMRSISPKKTVKKSSKNEKTKSETKQSSVHLKDVPSTSCDKKADINIDTTVNKSNKSTKVKSVQNKGVNKKSNKQVDVDDKPGPSRTSSLKRPVEEVLDLDLNSSIESNADLKQSSAESESELYEESSQANTLSEEDDNSSSCSVNFDELPEEEGEDFAGSNSSWTRDEDKIILETFQKEPDKDKVFQTISKLLSNRTIYQIKNRFVTLMSLIQKMTDD